MLVQIFKGDTINVENWINAWLRERTDHEVVRTDCTYAEGEGSLVAMVWYKD